MKKIYSLFAASLALTAMMSSCTTEDVLQPDVDVPGVEEENGLVPIELQAPILASATTRASINPGENGRFLLPNPADGESLPVGAFCLPLLSGTSTWENAESKLLHWSNLGLTTKPDGTNFYLEELTGNPNPRYYPTSNVPCLFAAYYPRHSTPLMADGTNYKNPFYEGNKVYVNLLLNNTNNYDVISGRSQTVDDPTAFSAAYASKEGAEVPMITFKHNFMRFNFVFKAGTQPGPGINVRNLYLNGFALKNVPSQGKLCVVDLEPDPEKNETGKFIAFSGWDFSSAEYKNAFVDRTPYLKNAVKVLDQSKSMNGFILKTDASNNPIDPFYPIDASGNYTDGMIVPVPYSPEDPDLAKNYQFTLQFSLYENGETKSPLTTANVNIGPGTNEKWEAGKSYKVVITLNSIERISASVELVPWDTNTDPIPVEL